MTFFSFFVAVLVASASARSIVLEQVPVLPAGWKKLDNAVSSDEDVTFAVALKQPKVDVAALMAQDGGHISRDDVRALRAPSQSSVDSVMKWLKDENISNITHDHDLIRVTTTVAEAEKLLGSKFSRYAYDDNVAKLRTQEYSIPEELEAISFIHPVANFMRPTRNRAQVSGNLANFNAAKEAEAASEVPCLNSVGISCLKQLYNITYQSPDNSTPVRFGISGYLEQNANHDDLKTFLKRQTNITNYDFTVETVNGGQDPGTPAQIEAMLDLEYGMGIAYPAPVTYYATGGRGVLLGTDGKPVQGRGDNNEPFLDFINHLLDKPDDELPHVLSVSYGDDELSVPKEYAKRVCDAYGLLTKRGTSIIHSSGDGGSTGSQRGNCRSRDGKNTKTTMPTFPASCPWVTSIGGTMHGTDPQRGIGFSSGGFSYYFDRPDWQTGVDSYISGLNGHLDGYYNKNGRAIPDVSLVADRFYTIVNGRTDYILGTSASAPAFSAMITLINDARLRAGKPSIGWLNKILYSEAGVAALADVTKGSSYGCDFANGGWPAAQGWDAITGLGEPRDFSKLMKLLYYA
ncbi:hypothetical protein PWT90_07953 [Aphanocladium album]|nr:hypothetical protein PWT90_07953 [Aphanocladium album]